MLKDKWISTMELIFERAVANYRQRKGGDAYDSLYRKISHSKALTELCGLSVRRGIPPTASDFLYQATMMPSIYLTFDNTKSTMAALIMLKIWNEQVNSIYNLCSEYQIEMMAQSIVSKCAYL